MALITRESDPAVSNTWLAQGGIIYQAEEGDPDLLVRDMLEAGAGLSYLPACQTLASEGPKLVRELLVEECGAPFERLDNGELALTKEAAHSAARIIHAEDMTGRAIEQAILEAVRKQPGIALIGGATAVDLLSMTHHSLDPMDIYRTPRCVGAYVLDTKKGEVVPALAHETILATGGVGQLYLHTTNPRGARGDGIAMANRIGARLLNMEFIQFHPTTLYHPESKGFLISETVRGEGGALERRNGERFMDSAHPMGSLAPRDVVARTIHDILLRHDEPCVYLNLTHKDADWIRGRFPNIYAQCLSLGIDITKQRIPVVPAAHYSCGGVAVDLEGRSSIAGLRAVGEVSCTGVHGANRLASTSLLEALVWGWRAGRSAAHAVASTRCPLPRVKAWIPEYEDADPALIHQDWLAIRHTMWNYVGLARSRKRMARARENLQELRNEIEGFYASARLTDDIVGLRNGVQAALCVLYAALANPRSRGCHYLVEHQ
ncbi:MAG: L-aspartate oxidase [candidate division BRC1 bacterium ADurb.BinA364]|nr:MAG: L-aspartate oxidase [candidate division BRC1 bacterium ADurb.BinA364]